MNIDHYITQCKTLTGNNQGNRYVTINAMLQILEAIKKDIQENQVDGRNTQRR